MIWGRLSCTAVLLAALLAAAAMLGTGAVASAATPQRGYIAFVRGGDRGPNTIWIADADGGDAHQLAAGIEAAISPNGAYVAVERYARSGPALELFTIGGKQVASYFDVAKNSVLSFGWSPSSRYLVASLGSTKLKGTGLLSVIDASTLKSRVLAHGVFAGASFNPSSTELVYGEANSVQVPVHVNLYTVPVTGGTPAPLTANGNSFGPVWTRSGIVFDRSTYRGADKAPLDQLWLDSSGKLRQLTKLKVPALLDGLQALGASADGNRLIAEYTGQDTSYAWTVQLSPLRIAPLRVDGKPVQASAISSDGQRVLVDVGAFAQAPDDGEVESVSFAGGAPTRLARGAQPSWSG